jgi:hypothetical protein
MDVGIGQAQEVWDIDSQLGVSDVLIPIVGTQVGFTAVSKRFESYSAILGLHYIRRGKNTDVPATVAQVEEFFQDDGLDVEYNGATGYATLRSEWLELELGARAWVADNFFLQGAFYAGTLLGGKVDEDYSYEIQITNPYYYSYYGYYYPGSDLTLPVEVETEATITPIAGTLTEDKLEELMSDLPEEETLVVRNKYNYGASMELGGTIQGHEIALCYRWSTSNIFPQFDESVMDETIDGLYGKQSFLSLRFGYRIPSRE